MKNRILLAVLLISSVLTIGFARAPQPSAVKFEYKVLYGAKERELNKLGLDGWEVVAGAAESSTSVTIPVFVLKRPLP